ncbi:hypothetical protein [Corynebacterium riegelii]|uniref:Uncharacterized protein n=1 Tax=Corynebacterium riegelii TaxID=156976 RepID=A0A0K1RA92_9CORY|nr:hypothetical protein [Corynebacterium riegelii]AKV58347.1 hypothetical protein AK829_03260 [Corynebacterium riegelii]
MSTTLVVTPAEAQPAAPNFQQIQKQIDATTRNALMNLWGPYEQLIRTFPQLKPLLDPVVNQFLPARKPVAAPVTTADSLFNAINAGVDTYNRAHPVPTGGVVYSRPRPMKRSPQLDAMAQRIANEAINNNASPSGLIENYPTPAPFEFHGALWETSDKPRSETEGELRAGNENYIMPQGRHWYHAGTAVAQRDGKYVYIVVYGGKNEYGVEDF